MSEQHRQLGVAVAQSALGAREVAHDHLVTEVRGRHLDVRLTSAHVWQHRTSRNLPYRILELQFPLAAPMRLEVNWRDNYVHMGPEPILSTGDAAFDATFIVWGIPADVVTPALDQTTRDWIRSIGPGVTVNDAGALTIGHAVTLPNERGSQPLTPERVVATAHALSHFATTLERCYQARRAEIVATQGEAAALAWKERSHKLIHRPRPIRWLVYGCFGLLFLAMVAGIGLFVWAMIDWTSL